MKPQRIQISRAKGWRKPPNTVVVSRPSKWGNPFKIGIYAMIGDYDRKAVHKFIYIVTPFKDVAEREPGRFTLIDSQETAVRFFRRLCEKTNWCKLNPRIISQLRGKNLACWCKQGTPCHADVLLELANQ